MNLLSKIHTLPFVQRYASLLLIVMSIQFVPIESFEVSVIKVGIMVLSLFVLIFKVFYLTKAFWSCLLYWLVCFFVSIFHEDMRFSTLGYLALFLITYITFYNLVYQGAFSLKQFKKLLTGILVVYVVVLILQQLSVIVGVLDMPLLNLMHNKLLSINNAYYEWNRLPSLSCEPSHSATIVTGIILGYIRCVEMENGGYRVSLGEILKKENRIAPLCYLYLILFMGSGTGWVGLAIVALYFVQWKSLYYIIPLFVLIIGILEISDNKQFDRAVVSAKATLSGDVTVITNADKSSSVRIVPLVNTFLRTDLNDIKSWTGKGTMSKSESLLSYRDLSRKIPVVEQYGLLGFIPSLLLIFLCVIRRLFSLETLYFIFILLCTVGNVYWSWSVIYVFTVVRYLQIYGDNV